MLIIGSLTVSVSNSSTSTAEEPNAGNWKTWVIGSAKNLRLPTPPSANSLQQTAELTYLEQVQSKRTQAQIDSALFWDEGPATKRWTEIQLEMIKTHNTNPVRAARGIAMMHIAMYDALVAAWDSKYFYNRPSPSSVDHNLIPIIQSRNNPSYPSEHAVVAGAASRILQYLYPEQGASWFESKANEAAFSRVWAGANYPSDVEQGLALGRVVADQVIARASTDRSDTPWDGVRPTGECNWKPTPPGFTYPPLEPTWGKVRPWLMNNGDQFRPGPPPACNSLALFLQMKEEVYRTVNTLNKEQREIALFWADGPGTVTPPGHWVKIALDLVEKHDTNTPRTARIFAYLGASLMDAGISVWDTKFTYWSIRPITWIQENIKHNWNSFLVTPPFPGYVSGHSGFSGAAAGILGHFFPQEKTTLEQMANEAALSRLYGGIHIQADNEVGLTMGKSIAMLAINRAVNDGAR